MENLKATHLAELKAVKAKGKIAESKIEAVKAKAAKAVSIVQSKANNLIKNAVKAAVFRLKHKKTKAQLARIAKAKADAK